MKNSQLTITALTCALITNAQINAALFRYPDVSSTQIVFTYANDLWVVPKEGGKALHLSSPAGVEVFPKFSPASMMRWASRTLANGTSAYIMGSTCFASRGRIQRSTNRATIAVFSTIDCGRNVKPSTFSRL